MKVLRCSNAHRWGRCPGSVMYERLQASSEDASRGTDLHNQAAECLRNGTDSDDEIVQEYVDYVRTVSGKEPILVEHEINVPLVGSGTIDALVLGEVPHVIDFKTGYKPVESFDNEQMYFYGAAVIEEYPDASSVTLTIVQPTMRSVDSVTVAADDLRYFVSMMTPRYRAARACVASEDSARENRNPGPTQCMYCSGLGRCREADWYIARGVRLGDQLALGEAVNMVEVVERWAKAVRAEAKHRLLNGEDVPGWKLVRGRRPNKRWCDGAEDQVVEVLGNDAYTKSIISPTQALRKRPETKAKLEDLIDYGEPSIQMVPQTDKRESISADF